MHLKERTKEELIPSRKAQIREAVEFPVVVVNVSEVVWGRIAKERRSSLVPVSSDQLSS
jgi:hypothetical protein